MNVFRILTVAGLGMAIGATIGCGDSGQQPRERKTTPPPTVSDDSATPGDAPAAAKSTAEAKTAEGWGTIKGVLLWTGSPHDPPQLNIEKDQSYCAAKREAEGFGPIVNEAIIVNSETNAIESAIVYMNVRGVPPIHPDYPQTREEVAKATEEQFKEANDGLTFDQIETLHGDRDKLASVKAPVLVDQIFCQYVPHGVGVRAGQTLVALNYEEVAHNILVSGLSGANDSNINMTPNTTLTYEWSPEPNPLSLKCSIHPWMEAYAMVFDHPYFDVTGKDGAFELKNLPAGEIDLVIRNPKDILGGRSKPYKVNLEPDQTVELEVKFDGTMPEVTVK